MFFKKLTIQNFMGIENRVIEFWPMTNVFGRNWSGKTSVREAILYALTGSIYGTPQIDGAVHNGKDFLQVTLEFEHKGATHILDRRRPLNGGYTTISLDGKWDVKQDIIAEKFWTWEEIASGICVGEFMNFEVDEKFDILSNLLPGDPAKIYSEMVGPDVAKKYPYGSMSFDQVDKKVKEVDKEIALIGSERMQISARINELSSLPKPEMTIDITAIEVAKAEHKAHQESRPVYSASDKTTAEKIFEIDKDIAALNTQKNAIVKPSKDGLVALKTRYDMLLVQKKAIEEAGVCQACKRPFAENEKETEVAILEKDIKVILETGAIDKKEYENAMIAYTQGVENIDKQIQIKQQEKLSLQKAMDIANSSGVTEYNISLDRWNARNNELQQKVYTLETDYRNQQTAVQQWNSNNDRIDELRTKDKELTEKLQTLDLLTLEKVKDALSPKGVTFREMESKVIEIKKFFPEWFDIQLLEKNKSNDNYKKVFIVTLNGVPYKWLSKGMKKIIDVYFSGLISEKKEFNTIIVDDIESLTTAIQPRDSIKQVITMCAKDTDFEVNTPRGIYS